jgi:hypothetical protein
MGEVGREELGRCRQFAVHVERRTTPKPEERLAWQKAPGSELGCEWSRVECRWLSVRVAGSRVCPGCQQTDLEAGRDEAVAGRKEKGTGQPQRGSRQAGREGEGG